MTIREHSGGGKRHFHLGGRRRPSLSTECTCPPVCCRAIQRSYLPATRRSGVATAEDARPDPSSVVARRARGAVRVRGQSVCTPTTHNVRHLRDSDSRCLSTSVPKLGGLQLRNAAIFWANSDESGGSKNRRLGQRKMWIRQVLISRTLSACGEVAERLKAAVC
jgi:hypothetical protein